MANRVWRWGLDAAWQGLVAFLPLSSVPLIANVIGSSSVAAASGIFLLILVLGGIFPQVVKGAPLPGQLRPLIAFALWGVGITLLSQFTLLPGFKNFLPWRNQIESMITLGIGISFYLTASFWVHSEKLLVRTLQIVNWSGFIMLLWCLAQGLAWAFDHRYPLWMREVQDLISTGVLYRQRVTGFTLEPSWLAHQLNLVYLPVWLASSVRRTTVHTKRILGLSFENMLVIGGLAALWFSYSRVGLLGTALMVLVLVWRATFWLIRNIPDWLSKRFTQIARSKCIHALVTCLVVILILTIYAGTAFSGLFVLSKVDPRMADVFKVQVVDDNPVLRYANALKFGERMVYWQTGWQIFSDHPVTGVGLGNAGFYFSENIPPYGWFLTEVRRLIYREDVLLNIKSLWVRLLSETGLVGFVIFVVWLVLVYASARKSEQSKSSTVQAVGLMGVLMLAAFIAEGFSIDSFALPYLWFTSGLATAASNLDIDPS